MLHNENRVFLGFATIGHLHFLCGREGQGQKNKQCKKFETVSY